VDDLVFLGAQKDVDQHRSTSEAVFKVPRDLGDVSGAIVSRSSHEPLRKPRFGGLGIRGGRGLPHRFLEISSSPPLVVGVLGGGVWIEGRRFTDNGTPPTQKVRPAAFCRSCRPICLISPRSPRFVVSACTKSHGARVLSSCRAGVGASAHWRGQGWTCGQGPC
jgi:hypothetical protein